MKARLLVIAGLLLLLSGFAIAQVGSSWTTVATFDAPFDFIVGGTTLPAGHYVVRTYSTTHALMIFNTDTTQSVIPHNNDVMLNGDGIHETTKVIFGLNSDGRQVLHQIAITGDNHTHDLIHDKSVTELVPSR